MRPHLALALLAVLAAAGGRPEDDARAWLGRLSSPAAEERELAQRWLARHLSSADYPDVARFAGGAGAEARRRLLEALAAEDRHLEVVVLLLSEEDPVLAELGRRAFGELVRRWCPEADGRPASRGEVLAALGRRVETIVSLQASRDRVAVDLERLARLADLPVPLVVAPEIQLRPSAPRPPAVGPATALLAAVCDADRCSFAGVGEWEDERFGDGAFVLVSTRAGALRAEGVERLADWCLSVQETERPSRRTAAAARALATTGWPAALRWLEARWVARQDRNALEGLVAAAERGVVAPALSTRAARVELLAAADAALASGDPEGLEIAARIARALAAAGGLAPDGEDPSPALVAGWERLGAAARWVRLVALEGAPSARPEVLAALVATVERQAGVEPALRLQALRALARVPADRAPAARPARLTELVDHARARGLEEELVGLLVACRVPVEGSLPEALPRGTPAREAAQVLVFEWCWSAGERAAAVGRLATDAARAPLSMAASSPWVRALSGLAARDGPGPARALVGEALARCAEDRRETLAQVALLAGALPAEEQVRQFDALAARETLGGLELELLAALAAGPRGAGALRRLRSEVEQRAGDAARRAELLRACVDAAERLRRAQLDQELGAFALELRLAVTAAESPLAADLSPPRFPPQVLPRPVPLEALDRRLPAGLEPR